MWAIIKKKNCPLWTRTWNRHEKNKKFRDKGVVFVTCPQWTILLPEFFFFLQKGMYAHVNILLHRKCNSGQLFCTCGAKEYLHVHTCPLFTCAYMPEIRDRLRAARICIYIYMYNKYTPTRGQRESKTEIETESSMCSPVSRVKKPNKKSKCKRTVV